MIWVLASSLTSYLLYINESALNIVDDQSDYYVSLEHFAMYGLRHYYEDYLALVQSLGYPSAGDPEFIGLIDYAFANVSDLCLYDYLNYYANVGVGETPDNHC